MAHTKNYHLGHHHNLPSYSEGKKRKWLLSLWMIGGFIVGISEYLLVRHAIEKKAAFICILTTFFLLFIVETWATTIGIWVWNIQTTFFMIGTIPIEEFGMYITSPLVTIGSFEIFHYISTKMFRK